MERIRVPGAELSTLRLGRGNGTPTVMLHGLVSGNMASWYFSAGLALAATRDVLMYDQRGHGDSSIACGSGFSLAHQVADLQSVLAHHALADAALDLVGHSMGALIALRFAIQEPQRVRRLVLVDAPMPAAEHVAPSLQEADALMAVPGRRGERQRRRLYTLLHETTLVADVLAMGPEDGAALAALRCPALLIYGRRSPCAATGVHLQRVLPRSELVWLDCGHQVTEEAPGALRQALERLLPVVRP